MRNKILSLLVLLVMAATGVWAQSAPKVWDFTATANDAIALHANPDWPAGSTGGFMRYTYIQPISDFTDLGDIGFAAGAGIQVGREGWFIDGIPENSIRADIGARFWVNGTNIQYKIPNLQAGDVVKIRCQSGNSSSDRSFTLTNGTVDSETPTLVPAPGAQMAETAITVAADGDLILMQDKGIHIAAIALNDDLPFYGRVYEFDMPDYDATAEYEYVRDIGVSMQFWLLVDENWSDRVGLAMGTDGHYHLTGNWRFVASDYLQWRNPTDGELIYGMEMWDEVSQTYKAKNFDTELAPGIWRIVATGNENMGYEGIGVGYYDIELYVADQAQVDASWIQVVPTVTYTGQPQTPKVIVKNGETTLVEGTDYTVVYSNNTNVAAADAANAPTVTITGIGNYQGEAKKTFSIVEAGAQIFAITVNPDEVSYTGAALRPEVIVKNDDITLVRGVDYTLAYTDNVNAGIATVIVTGIGNYSGSQPAYFTIVPAELTEAVVTERTFIYNGEPQGIGVSAVYVGSLTVPYEGYEVSGYEATEVGNYTATVTGKGNYTGTITIPYSIVPNLAAQFTLTIDAADLTYDGTAQTPAVTVKDGNKTLVEGTDYTLSIADNVNAGTATVTVTGIGKYNGSTTATFTIAKAALTEVTLEADEIVYDGDAHTVDVTGVKAGEQDVPESDYTVSGNTGTEIGIYTVTVTAKENSNYTGSVSTDFIIMPEIPAIETAANEAEGNNDKVGGVKFNLAIDQEAGVKIEERTFVDPATGKEVTRSVIVVPVVVEGIIILKQTEKKKLVVTVPGYMASANGMILYEVTTIAANAFVSDEPTATVTTVILPDTEEPLKLEEGAMNTGTDEVMKVITPLKHLDDYALDNALVESYQALKISAFVTPVNRYWTFSCGVDVVAPEGMDVFTCRVSDEKEVKITQLDETQLMVDGKHVIKANNGVLLACTDGTDGNAYEIVANPGRQESGTKPAADKDAKDYGLDNMLEPVIDSKHYKVGEYYVLKDNVFHPILPNTSKVPACKAVLRYVSTSNARLTIVVEGGTTGIDEITGESGITGNLYDLNGRLIQNKPLKCGVYIINNKKVMIKK